MSDENVFVPAWDPVLRFLHWWNALYMTAMLFTGAVFAAGGDKLPEAMEGNFSTAHSVAGYLLAGGLLARVLWLFVGPETARWTDMLPISAHQRSVFAGTLKYYLRGLRGTPPLYFAHNPFAGVIYLGFFAAACIEVASGVVYLGLPGALRESLVHEVHEAGFLLILLFIAAHLAAVFVHEVMERHTLISAMVNGRKAFTRGERELLGEVYTAIRKGDIDER